MLLEAINQAKEKVRQTLIRAKQAVGAVADKVRSFCQNIYNTLADDVRLVIDYVSPPVKDANEAETRWIVCGAGSVIRCIEGDDPVDTFCQMDPEERLEALENIAIVNAQLMGIEPCRFQVSDELPANTMGYYLHKERSITLNAALVKAQPITREIAKQAIMTVIHEMFHAYQYIAMFEPHKFGIPEEIAAYWRRSARDYCSFEQNPSYYYLQPLESYARYVEEGAMEWLRDSDLVMQIRSRWNSKEGA